MAVELKKLKSESVVQQIINTLTDAIVNGDIKPGEQIPVEMEMASQMGVARTSVREATKILTYMGILESRRSEGTFVTDGFNESMIDPMVYGVLITGGEDFDRLMELRQTMESGITRLAIRHKTDEGLENLRKALDGMRDAAASEGTDEEVADRLFEADNGFHDAVADLTDNPLMTKIDKIVRMLTYATRRETVRMMYMNGRSDELIDAHQDIYNIIHGGDANGLDDAIEETYFLTDIRKAHESRKN